MGMNLSLIQIRYFLAVAETLSYTEAARRLSISQPSLSKQVALLEAEMGLLLFKRDRRSVNLTPAGAAFAEDMRGLFASLERSVGRAQQLALGAGGQIRLAIPEGMILDPLQAVLRGFLETHPGIQFQVERLNLHKAREALLSGGADLLFTLSFETDSLRDCECRTLARRKGCWILSREHPLGSKLQLEAGDFSNLSLVIVSQEVSPGGYATALRNCEQMGIHPKSIIQAPSFDAVLTYVELGHGVAIVGRPLAERNTDRFRAYDLPEDSGGVGMVLCWRKRLENPGLGLFVDYLRRELKAEA